LDEAFPRIAGQLRLPRGRRPTAIFTPTPPELERGPWREMLDAAGLRVPEDLTIMSILGNGEDRSQVSGYFFDGFDLGEMATRFMLQMIATPRVRRHRPHVIRVKGGYHPGKTHVRAP
jgi:hypothetical protein